MTPERPPGTAQAIAEDPIIRDCLYLVLKRVPFDVAFSLDDETRHAWCVIMGEHEGGRFDWGRGEWRKQD